MAEKDALIVDPQAHPLVTLETEMPRVAESKAQVAVVNGRALDLGILLQDLYDLIRARQEERPEGSYTTYLFNQGLDKILKKVGEETAETIIAAKNCAGNNGNSDELHKLLAGEIGDLLYHLLVLMVERNVSLQDIQAELAHRAGKPAQAKYTSAKTDK